MKITKKAFIEAMTASNSTLMGITKRLFDADEVYCSISDVLDNKVIVETRSCIAKSNSLLFCNGSSLYLDQVGKYEFHKYTYGKDCVYICNHISYDDFDEVYRHKCMYYLVKA